jgi:hypothetical protein
MRAAIQEEEHRIGNRGSGVGLGQHDLHFTVLSQYGRADRVRHAQLDLPTARLRRNDCGHYEQHGCPGCEDLAYAGRAPGRTRS